VSPLALDALRERWVQRLGLHRLIDRPAPFETAGVRAGTASGAGEADITVLIPAFQHERYIGDAVRSVLDQADSRFRILVADDGSTDRTVERARALDDPRVTVTVNAQNVGLGRSLVAALEHVDTPFVALLNSDDVYHPQRLSRCREVLVSEPRLRAVATGIMLIDARGRRLTPGDASRLIDGRRIFHWVQWYGRTQAGQDREALFLRLLRHNVLLTSSNIVCHTSFLREHSTALAELRYCVDWHLFLTAAATDRLGYLPEPLLAYRLHAGNTVWFSPRTRPAYSAEVNRVATRAIRDYLGTLSPSNVETAKRDIASAVAANTELDERLVQQDCDLAALKY